MNVINAIGWALIHVLWQGLLVAGVLAATLALLSRRSANARYIASCLALAFLLLLAFATAVRSYNPRTVSVAPPASATPVLVHAAEARGATPVVRAIPTSLRGSIAFRLPAIVAIWFAGVAFLSMRLLFAWMRVRRMIRGSAAAVWQTSVDRIAGAFEIRRLVRVIESVSVEVPTVIGWLRPVILLPCSTISGMSPQQIEMILAHELAHIRRHDFFVNLLQSIAETLLFYHPAVWWMSRRIRIERENCCDDLAVSVCGDAVQYARTLTRLEELRGEPALAMAASGGSLLQRVRRLVKAPDDVASGSRWIAALSVLAVAFIIAGTIVVPALARQDAPTPPPAPPAKAARPARVPKTPKTPKPPMIAAAQVAARIAGLEIDVEPPEEPSISDDEHSFGADGPLTIDELIALRIHEVTPEYIDAMRAAGIGTVSLAKALELRIHDVTPEYAREMNAAGVTIRSADDLLAMAIHDVEPDFVRSLVAAGYTKLTASDLARMASAGIDADFIRQMSKYREKK